MLWASALTPMSAESKTESYLNKIDRFHRHFAQPKRHPHETIAERYETLRYHES
jgi:hypothetical protein